jgi:hypothetical protein
MSILSTLSAADSRLANQLDAVTSAVEGIGAATLAAKRRLAVALAAARSRMASCLADVEALTGEFCEDVLTAVEGDLLTLPEPVTEEEAMKWTDDAPMMQPEPVPACDDCGVPIPPDRANETGPQRCVTCDAAVDADPGELPDAPATGKNAVKDYYEDAVKEAPVNRMPLAEAIADPAGFVSGMTETAGTSSTPPANGRKPRKRR